MSKVIAWPGVGEGRNPWLSLMWAAYSVLGMAWRPAPATEGFVLGRSVGFSRNGEPGNDGPQDRPAQSDERSRLRGLEAIFAISAALRTAPGDEEMVPIILDKTLEMLQAQHGAIVLQEVESSFAVRQGRGCMQKDQGRPLPPDFRFGGRPLDLTRSHLTERLSVDLRETGLDGDGRLGPGILMPLRTPAETLGFIVIGRQTSVRFDPADVDVLTAIAEMASNALSRIRLHKELEDSFLGTVLALANAVDAKDTYTGGHSARLAEMAAAVGKQLGITNGFFEDLRWGAMLHDIGKIGVPDHILRKPTPLTPEDWGTIRQHPVTGAQILAPVAKLAGASRIVRHHHEWWDGRGYPDGLSGEEIPLGARILAVVDAYSAITDERAYKASRSHSEAVKELQRCSGTQFDPSIVQAFVAIMS